jgi:hypothetical protein
MSVPQVVSAMVTELGHGADPKKGMPHRARANLRFSQQIAAQCKSTGMERGPWSPVNSEG